MRGASRDDREYLKTIPIIHVVKMQSLIRGYIARKKVQRVYGFKLTAGLMDRGFEMDP